MVLLRSDKRDLTEQKNKQKLPEYILQKDIAINVYETNIAAKTIAHR